MLSPPTGMAATTRVYYFQKCRRAVYPLEFILLFSISLIPLFCGIIIFWGNKIALAKSIAYFLFFLSIWQIDIAFLYAQDYLSKPTIDFLFRLFRFGPIMIMPLLYYIAFCIFKTGLANKNIKKHHKLLFNKWIFYFVLLFSSVVYAVNFTSYGVSELNLIHEYPSFPAHYIPIYSTLNITFDLNIILVFVHSFLLLFICQKISDGKIKEFLRSLVFASLFIFVNGILSGFLVLPLFFSILNTICAAIILFAAYFVLQNATIEKMNQELKEERRFLEIILNINPNFIYVKDSNDQLVIINAALAELCNKSSDEMIGVKENKFNQEVLFIEEEKDSNETVIHCNGGMRIVEWQFLPIYFKGNHDHTLCLGTDITKRKKEEEMLVKSENLRVLGEMAAGIAHEIRNPLTSIKGFIKLLDQSVFDSNEKYYLSIISDEIDRINDVVGELLFIAKPQASGQTSKIVNIDKVIHDVKILLDSTALLIQASIEIQTKGILKTSAIEEKQVKQVLINILKNSLEAVSKNGRIRIKSEEIQENRMRIRVIDNGDGIAKFKLQKLGEPFYTTKERGTGLGLTVCFKILRENNGNIVIRSKEGIGTIVDIILPK
ncbi:Adaptive-response sensory-kinase SasA [Neobacillus rhizosphaerae]|uniref:histidine kinase n=1 Tax=Neobacillus rhizosphaerae TaxID=2880965 RepID=A0ABN8KV51_9BACI|nr:ATP-binding protein [Neobacillus rhizosphaerae]CAH2716362.1 Adaptive-response sensory-kinase SasA [Neobacillus rhizosphaerae]